MGNLFRGRDHFGQIYHCQMNRNSSLIWLPVVEKLANSPHTVTILINMMELWGAIENEKKTDEERISERTLKPLSDDPSPIEKFVHKECEEMIKNMPSPETYEKVLSKFMVDAKIACEIVGYPVFLRTDLSSAKHQGPKVYRIDNEDQIKDRVLHTLMDNEMKWLNPSALLFRKHLDLDSSFEMFDGFPISREWRLFVDGDEMKCFHPYWPKEVMIENNPPSGWEEILLDHHQIPQNIEELGLVATQICKELGGEWSIDFSCDRDGKWWLTDMALAQDSYHMNH